MEENRVLRNKIEEINRYQTEIINDKDNKIQNIYIQFEKQIIDMSTYKRKYELLFEFVTSIGLIIEDNQSSLYDLKSEYKKMMSEINE